MKDLDIAIKRERGGAFQIGKTTFEELFATILKQAMQSKSGGAVIIPSSKEVPPAPTVPNTVAPAPQSKLVPQLPPADKPRLSPIEVRDSGVRG